ncbi:MAG: hypothetical protein ACWGSQ_02625 [Longimicrobiales bacterium]
MPRTAALPFTLKRSQEVLGLSSITSTTEMIHGLLRLDGDRVVIQWRLGRKTEHIGGEIRTDREYEAVKEVVIPLEALAGATVRRRWWELFLAPKLVLTGADLQAFEEVAGEEGLRSEHPAEVVVKVRRRDRMLAEEFAAELELAVAERSLARHQERSLGRGRRESLPDSGRPEKSE